MYMQVHLCVVQAAAEHLPEHLPELLRGHVVEERVDHGAEVEEGIREGQEDHVCPEVRSGPVMFGFCCSHDPSDLIGHPTHGQCHHNQSWQARTGEKRRRGEKQHENKNK
uniref:Uncharacterized protein n=1 Tax=Mus spicilegus TaxID=10103 RepID=A0A8C6G765_MUSSI